ncbi:hypothetical protein [Plantibacter flavus]|uniref:hypothetical protein n=1 Tax=Plantibacter flavus TaxID=150123 RepID=UPI0010C198EE|nr:hypothetical protein [Plantibacter flavus]
MERHESENRANSPPERDNGHEINARDARRIGGEAMKLQSLETQVVSEYLFRARLADSIRSYGLDDGPPPSLDALDLSSAAKSILRSERGRSEAEYWSRSFHRTLSNMDWLLGQGGGHEFTALEWNEAIEAISKPLESFKIRLEALALLSSE